jgi:hypothetical protein
VDGEAGQIEKRDDDLLDWTLSSVGDSPEIKSGM